MRPFSSSISEMLENVRTEPTRITTPTIAVARTIASLRVRGPMRSHSERKYSSGHRTARTVSWRRLPRALTGTSLRC